MRCAIRPCFDSIVYPRPALEAMSAGGPATATGTALFAAALNTRPVSGAYASDPRGLREVPVYRQLQPPPCGSEQFRVDRAAGVALSTLAWRLASPGAMIVALDRNFIMTLVEEHRAIEAGLDRLAEAIRSGKVEPDAMRQMAESIARHYLREERFLSALGACDPKLAAKLRAQHDEASEICERLLESSEGGDAAEAVYLSRRFIAIAQHNIIEEERDVFPLADRMSGSEQTPG